MGKTDAIVQKNLGLMQEARREGGMHYLLNRITFTPVKTQDTAANFYFDKATGEIIHFGYDKDKQNNVPSQYASGRFGIVVKKHLTPQRRIILEITDVFIEQDDGHHSKVISKALNILNPTKEVLEKTVQLYNNSSPKNEIKY